MSIIKELWFQAYEQLKDKLGREPTSKEVDTCSADILAGLIDDAYETTREAGLPCSIDNFTDAGGEE